MRRVAERMGKYGSWILGKETGGQGDKWVLSFLLFTFVAPSTWIS